MSPTRCWSGGCWGFWRARRVAGGGGLCLASVQVESVAWITERKNVLMGFFFFLTLWAWIKFIDNPGRHSWRFYILALVCCALALAAQKRLPALCRRHCS